MTTRKYSINGAGLKNRGGFVWVNKKRGWIEDMEIDLPDNPEWQNFKFKLTKVEKMNRAEWEKFMAAQIEKTLSSFVIKISANVNFQNRR